MWTLEILSSKSATRFSSARHIYICLGYFRSNDLMAQYQIAVRRSRRSDSSADLDELGSPLHKRPRKGELDAPCDLCALMFSEMGLRRLNSPDGFTHHTHDECITSRDGGCIQCQLILDLASWTHDDVWGSDDRMVFRNRSSVTGLPTSDIDVLQGSLEGRPDVISIYPFAKACTIPSIPRSLLWETGAFL